MARSAGVQSRVAPELWHVIVGGCGWQCSGAGQDKNEWVTQVDCRSRGGGGGGGGL